MSANSEGIYYLVDQNQRLNAQNKIVEINLNKWLICMCVVWAWFQFNLHSKNYGRKKSVSCNGTDLIDKMVMSSKIDCSMKHIRLHSRKHSFQSWNDDNRFISLVLCLEKKSKCSIELNAVSSSFTTYVFDNTFLSIYSSLVLFHFILLFSRNT